MVRPQMGTAAWVHVPEVLGSEAVRSDDEEMMIATPDPAQLPPSGCVTPAPSRGCRPQCRRPACLARRAPKSKREQQCCAAP